MNILRRLISSIRIWEWFLLVLAFAVVIEIGRSKEIRQPDVQFYWGAPEVINLSRVELSEATQKIWDETFANSQAFSAFAVNSEGRWGYYTGANSLAYAKEIALNFCNSGLDSAKKCAVVATITPTGYEPTKKITMNKRAQEGFDRLQERKGSRAMAISRNGAWFSAWERSSRDEAIADALEGCRANLEDSPGYDEDCFVAFSTAN